MKKLTKREKIIIGVSSIVVVAVAIKLRKKAIKLDNEYNLLASELCSGGAWKAVPISKTHFKLTRVIECCGKKCVKV